MICSTQNVPAQDIDVLSTDFGQDDADTEFVFPAEGHAMGDWKDRVSDPLILFLRLGCRARVTHAACAIDGICLSVCLSLCLSVLSVYLPACLPACLSVLARAHHAWLTRMNFQVTIPIAKIGARDGDTLAQSLRSGHTLIANMSYASAQTLTVRSLHFPLSQIV